jgi:hypothetical protein
MRESCTQPSIQNSTARWNNHAKKSLKYSLTIGPHLPPHPLADLEALAATQCEPVVEVDLLGGLVGLGDPQDALHDRNEG